MSDPKDLSLTADAATGPSATAGQVWQPIATAPKDGTVINAVGRYRDATAGFPMYVSWFEGAWRQPCRSLGEPMICWAWRPRDDWPAEAPRRLASDAAKLMPCPFCGSPDVDMFAHAPSGAQEYTFAACIHCDAAGPSKASVGAASTAWNGRPSNCSLCGKPSGGHCLATTDCPLAAQTPVSGDGGKAAVEHWYGSPCTRLSVPGRVAGRQVISAAFADGSQVSVEADTLDDAWVELRQTLKDLQPMPQPLTPQTSGDASGMSPNPSTGEV